MSPAVEAPKALGEKFIPGLINGNVRIENCRKCRRIGTVSARRAEIGAPGEIRTPNPQIRSLVLYPLSYGRKPSCGDANKRVPAIRQKVRDTT
jgi:hypothetical protein